ncbi:MAG: hypothetical protein GEV12_14375 [Micromonosporaceae bacterium]|nr:hypothetical protein [Micromonosporaceae bacterium]
MDELAPLLAGGGVFTALVVVIGYLLRAMHRDRGQYEDAIDRAEARANAAEERTQAAWRMVDEARRAADRHAESR